MNFEAPKPPFCPWTAVEEGIVPVCLLGMRHGIHHELPPPLAGRCSSAPFTQDLQQYLLTAVSFQPPLSRVRLLAKA